MDEEPEWLCTVARSVSMPGPFNGLDCYEPPVATRSRIMIEEVLIEID